MFISFEDRFNSIVPIFNPIEDRFNSFEDRPNSFEDGFNSIEDRFNSQFNTKYFCLQIFQTSMGVWEGKSIYSNSVSPLHTKLMLREHPFNLKGGGELWFFSESIFFSRFEA